MIISEDNRSNHIIILDSDEWNIWMLHREHCLKLQHDEDSNFEMPQDEYVLLDNIK